MWATLRPWSSRQGPGRCHPDDRRHHPVAERRIAVDLRTQQPDEVGRALRVPDEDDGSPVIVVGEVVLPSLQQALDRRSRLRRDRSRGLCSVTRSSVAGTSAPTRCTPERTARPATPPHLRWPAFPRSPCCPSPRTRSRSDTREAIECRRDADDGRDHRFGSVRRRPRRPPPGYWHGSPASPGRHSHVTPAAPVRPERRRPSLPAEGSRALRLRRQPRSLPSRCT